MNESEWDVIVIGAGLGGLSAAAYLATNGMRALVLEQYDVAGGCSHVFRRQGFEFDVGVHYVGDCGPEGVIPTVLRGVGLGDQIEFLEMDPDGFDTLVFPELTFRVPRGWDRYLARLLQTFPDEEPGLRECVGALRDMGEQLGEIPPPRSPGDLERYANEAPAVAKWGLLTLSALYDQCRLSTLAKAVIAGQGGGHGAPPSRVAAGLHAGLLHHCIGGGAYYPRGGGQVVAAHLVDVIKNHGGEVRTGCRVARILTKGGAVAGVASSGGDVATASTVISNADIKRTFLELLEPAAVSKDMIDWMQRARMALPVFTVYLGLDIDLRERLPNTNYWCHGSSDPELMYRCSYDGRLPDEISAYITSASIKDPSTRRIAPPGHTSLEVMTMVPPDYAYWGLTTGPAAGERYRRHDHYRSVKDDIIERLVDRTAALIPGLRDHIVWKEGATPITQERYTLSSGGACYGLELSPDQFGPHRPAVTTEIDGLYLAGASTIFGHGISSVLSGGVGTAGAILGRDLMTEVKAGAVFGDPTLLNAGGPEWDPLAASRMR